MRKQVKNFINYLIDENGEIYNITTKKILKGSISESGYKYYRLSKNGKKTLFYAHRLVAEIFLENPNQLPVVNHIDGNKLNNNINNLRQITNRENVLAALYTTKTNHSAKQVEQYDLKGNLLNIFPSAAAAARILGLDASVISKVCRGDKYKTHGGFVFKYSI